MLRLALAFILLACVPAKAATVLFENTCPQPVDAAYLAGVENLKQAIRSGMHVHVYMLVNGEEYMTELTAMRLMPQSVNALLPMRPFIDGEARVSRNDGIVGGSLDTYGHYRYAPWVFDSGVRTPITDAAACYVIRWFGT